MLSVFSVAKSVDLPVVISELQDDTVDDPQAIGDGRNAIHKYRHCDLLT